MVVRKKSGLGVLIRSCLKGSDYRVINIKLSKPGNHSGGHSFEQSSIHLDEKLFKY